jgi:hypothetical protein
MEMPGGVRIVDGDLREASMMMTAEALPAEGSILDAERPASETPRPSLGLGLRSQDIRMFGVIFISNTTLFSAMDLAQWLADRFEISSLPTNMIAAVIATALGIVFTAAGRWLGVHDA